MPITKVPIVHKFGIISSTHRLQLQERLLKQAYLSQATKIEISHRNPIEITEDFVQLFNSTTHFEDKKKNEEKARKLLERAKRRAGLKKCGYGSHVNLPLAWTELAQLAQCKGRIQEESLDILVTSLDVSPLDKHHIPALFFLAEIMLYLLRTEVLHCPFLKTPEMKLLKMGQLVFERLFYHHMAGQLQEHTDSKRQLSTYIDGLNEFHEVYDFFPYALLCLKFVTEVGKIILADFHRNHENMKSGQVSEVAEQNISENNVPSRNMYENLSSEDIRSIQSRAISSSVHDLSPTLWHALDVFRCTHNLSGGLNDALKALEHCGSGLASETWVDGMVAIQMLGESAKTNMAAMKALHRLTQGTEALEEIVTELWSRPVIVLEPRDHSQDEDADFERVLKLDEASDLKVKAEVETEKVQVPHQIKDNWFSYVPGIAGWHWEVAVTYTEVLANIVLYGSTANIQKYALVGNNSDTETVYYKEHKSCDVHNRAALIDLAFFKQRNKTSDEEQDKRDDCWRIRCAATQALVKIYHSLKGDRNREGLRSTAWNILLKAEAKEKDSRVLEALKVEQVRIDIHSFLDSNIQGHPPSIGKHIAVGLASLYLPPLLPLTASSASIKVSPKPSQELREPNLSKPAETRALRTFIKQEIEYATPKPKKVPDYNTRKGFDLRRIVEDQWRKELQAKLEEEMTEKVEASKEKLSEAEVSRET